VRSLVNLSWIVYCKQVMLFTFQEEQYTKLLHLIIRILYRTFT